MAKYFDDFEVGDKLESPFRTINEKDVLEFAKLTGDSNPLHTDKEFAKKSIFGERIVHGMLTISITTGLVSSLGIFYGTVLAFVGLEAKFLVPVYFGDSIKTEITVIDKEKTPRTSHGKAVFLCRTINQNNVLVAETKWTLLLRKRR